jgi:hypothetical protein
MARDHTRTGKALKPSIPAHLNARAIKVTVVLDASEVARLAVPEGQPRVTLSIRVGGEISVGGERLVTAELAAKSVRKAQAAIIEQGVAVVLQGRLVAGDVLAEAGLACQPKAPKSATMETAA